MTKDETARKIANGLRELADGMQDVDAFDIACVLELEATSRFAYSSEDVLKLADVIDPDNVEWCSVCGHVIPDGWDECPKCATKAVWK